MAIFIPIILGAFLRQVVMAVASGAVVTLAQKLLDGTFKTLVEELRDTEGLTEQEAKDIVGNILIDLSINSAAILTVLKTGAGVKAAEYLGLTSRNFSKAALTKNAENVATKLAATGGRDMAKRLLTRLPKIIPSPISLFWVFVALTQVIEPAIYAPGQLERILGFFGIDVDIPGSEGNKNPGPFSADSSVSFAEYAGSLEAAGIKGINNPAALQSQIYSREALAMLVNYIYGQEVSAGRNPSVKQLIPMLSQYLVMPSSSTPVPSPAVAGSTPAIIPKVYTGIISQGVIGKGIEFTPRPDDLIESVEELKQAAANNLAPFLQALPSKIVYEVKVVPSIITKDGFKQTGTVQQIANGKTASGAPKFKTVTNKFATLNIYVVTDKGVRSKITTIVLGPTNSAKLTLGLNDLRTVETQLPEIVTTTDINEITGIESDTSVTVSTPTKDNEITNKLVAEGKLPKEQLENIPQVQAADIPGLKALTLLEWFTTQGRSLPPVSERAVIYEEMGLGNRNYYTGTTEQNTKLLNALKIDAIKDEVERLTKLKKEQEAREEEAARVAALKAKTGGSSSSSKTSSTGKTSTSQSKKEPEPKKIRVAYTTVDGIRVTKYTDGSETRVDTKK